MRTISYLISPDLFTAHPAYRRGVVAFSGLDNSRPHPQLTQLLRESEQLSRTRISGNPAEVPEIAAWRDAYRQFGAKPSEHRSSIEALTRRVLKPNNLPDINPLVDIGNLLSLRYMLPAGVHPIGEDAAAIELRETNEHDRFLPNVGEETQTIPPGEIVLAEGARVLTRRWTWRQAGDTRTLPATSAVFFDIDGLPPTSEDQVTAAIADAIELVERYCGGTCVGHAVLDATRPSAVFQIDQDVS